MENGRAVGVEYTQGGQTKRAEASREVILCGGAINSPHLLLLSGIGPADQLRANDIAVVMDLPGVGENLQDHMLSGVSYVCAKPITLMNAERLDNVLEYLVFHRGKLTSNVAEAGGFVNVDSDAPAPQIQFHFAPAYFVDHGFTKPRGARLQPGSDGRAA